MVTILEKIFQNENFQNNIEDKIAKEINGKNATVIDDDEGLAYGIVIDYVIDSAMNLTESSIEDLKWSLKLEFTGEATVEYKKYGTTETDATRTLEGSGSAIVLVTIPSEVLTIEDVNDIIDDLDIEIEEASAYTEEEDELDEELHNKLEKEDEEYHKRRSELESLSVEALIDKIMSLENEIVQLKKQILDK